MKRVPFAPGVFTWPADAPQLIGSRCLQCRAVTFPSQDSCPRCGAQEMKEHLLPRLGRLHSWTTQEFLPKEPYASGETLDTFKPYGVGLVQLGDDVRVEGRLTEHDPSKLEFDMEVEVVAVPFRVDPADSGGDGIEILVYAFKPVGSQGVGDA
ncbi:MAG: Zn-ribbon domain-containing OB-fold protein [Thermoanaerobaculia bacterium]